MNKNLINARKEVGLTQAEIADIANISTRTYQKYEAGEFMPNSSIAIDIAKVLHKTVEELFSSSETNKQKESDGNQIQ